MAADLDRIAYRLQAQPCILRRLNEIDTLLASGSAVPAGGEDRCPRCGWTG
jgi:tRNA A37 threonylcarbamoyladenosine synthetase subunit TsaC/SUA5/YrdC